MIFAFEVIPMSRFLGDYCFDSTKPQGVNTLDSIDYKTARDFIACDLIEVVSLGEIQVQIGGETHDFKNAIMIVNEEGKLVADWQMNPWATFIIREQVGMEVIAGNAIICESEDFQ